MMRRLWPVSSAHMEMVLVCTSRAQADWLEQATKSGQYTGGLVGVELFDESR